MIPRLWVCTSHPWLVLLSFPLHPLGIYSVSVLSTLASALGARRLARRFQRLWLTLLAVFVAVAGSLLVVGTLLAWIGVNPNALYVGARYAWIPLAWGAVAWSSFRGRNTPDRATHCRMPVVDWGLFGLALAGLGVLAAWPFVSSAINVFTVPYRMVEFALDQFNTSRASDECNAAHVSEYRAGNCFLCTPGESAESTLKSRGVSARDGLAAYLEDRRIHPNPDWHGSNYVVKLLAETGKHPYLDRYEPGMAACLNSGRRVVDGHAWWTPARQTWACLPARREEVAPQEQRRW